MTREEAARILEESAQLLKETVRIGDTETMLNEGAIAASRVCTIGADAIRELDVRCKQKCLGEWISIRHRLPEQDSRVLVAFRSESGNSGIEDCFYSGFRNRFVLYHTFDEVPKEIRITHWMPLPGPPKEDA